jgi:radical S-adenosyl methionine domain-containing protein 2
VTSISTQIKSQITLFLKKDIMEPRFVALLGTLAVLLVSWIINFGYRRLNRTPIPVSVNYHLTRKCNYECGFCFHTAKTSHILSIEKAKEGLALLKRAGMKKLNFAGGEPMLYADFVGELAEYCKTELRLESVSIVTNGSLMKPGFFEKYGKYIDIIAVSCDSFDEATNIKIGRGKGKHLQKFAKLRITCQEYGIKFKVNTVVCKYNFAEDMRDAITEIAPFRWKCFQVLVVKGENDSKDTLRDATDFVITDEQFQQFCDLHSDIKGFVPEPNDVMKDSYLILDEYMRFLDKGNNPSKSILEVGVKEALDAVYFDEKSFMERGGVYDWGKEDGNGGCGGKDTKGLDW